MSSCYSRHAGALALCALPLTVGAQTTPALTTLDTIVVTATRTPQIQRDVPGDVSVIERHELQQAGQDSLADLLGRQSGIETAASGGPQTQTSVFLRGTNPQQTLVLLNGIRLNSSSSGAVNWNAIDPATVERVEIVRGAASSLYGSNAIGGVINIITRPTPGDTPLRAWGNVGAGSHSTFKSSTGIAGTSGKWNYAFSASMANSGGFNATNRSNTFYEYYPDSDGYSQHTLSGSVDYQWAQGQELAFSMYNGYINGDFDAGEWSPEAYGLTRQEVYSLTSTNQVTRTWESVLRFGFSSESADSRSFGSSYLFGELQRSYLWQNTFALSADHSVSVLLERLEERPKAGSTQYTANERNTNSAGLVYRGNAGAHHLQASVRNDTISAYGSKVTGGLSYDYDLSGNWTVGMAANTGFRAPTFADLYAPYYFGSVGNPDLKPESSRNVEASVRYTDDTTLLQAVLFQNRIDDMIVGYVYNPATGLRSAQNIDKARIRGLSLSAEKTWGDTRLKASADFMDPRNLSPRDGMTGNQLQRRARQIYRVSATHRLDALVLGAEYMFTGKRYDDAANTLVMGGYGVTNLSASYDFSRRVGISVRWDNVFNKDYANVYGYNPPGSTVFINLSVRM